jgi:hypothetical protein
LKEGFEIQAICIQFETQQVTGHLVRKEQRHSPSSLLFLTFKYKIQENEGKKKEGAKKREKVSLETHHSNLRYNAADFWSSWCIGEIRTELIIQNRGNTAIDVDAFVFCPRSTIQSHPLPNKKPRRCNFIIIYAVLPTTFGLGCQYQGGWFFLMSVVSL